MLVALFAATPIPILRAMLAVRRNYSPARRSNRWRDSRALAWLMGLARHNLPDRLDPPVGLIPIVGDVISGLISTYLIWEARRLGAPKWLIARMMANTLFDTAVGSAPVVGDALDALFRSTMKKQQ